MATLVLVTVVLLLIALPVIIVNRDILFNRTAGRRQIAEAPLPFLIFPLSSEESRIVPAGLPESGRDEDERLLADSDDERSAWAATASGVPNAEPQPSVPAAAIAEPSPLWPRALSEEDYANSVAADATMVFNRPVDEPVQILPGRLRVLSGENTGQELRLFNKLGEPPRIVVGRDPGPPHEHITLRSPTVSRRHARMELVDGCWTITNLSTTNPVLVNDRALVKDGATRKLADGDRIELGEVALRFLAS